MLDRSKEVAPQKMPDYKDFASHRDSDKVVKAALV
jgi:hypothetical protein